MVEPLSLNFRVFTVKLVGVRFLGTLQVYIMTNEPHHEKTCILHMQPLFSIHGSYDAFTS